MLDILELSETKYKVYCLLVGAKLKKVNPDGLQHTLSQIASIIEISVPAIHRHKEHLLRDGYVIKSPGRSFWDRGPRANIIESTEVKKVLNINEQTLGPSNHGPSKKISVETLRGHMHGGLQFRVDKVGDHAEFEYRPKDAPQCFIPFLEITPYLNHNNNEMYNGKIKIPLKKWGCTVVYHHTPTKDLLRIFPPEVNLTTDQILADPEASKHYPTDFFKKEVYEILNFIEKWAGWKFKRAPGCSKPIGNPTGPVSFGYSHPMLERAIPKGMKGVEGYDEVEFDRSPGELEVESQKIRNGMSIAMNAIEHDSLNEKYQRMKEHLVNIYDMVEDMLKVQEAQLHMDRLKDMQQIVEKRKQKTLDNPVGYE